MLQPLGQGTQEGRELRNVGGFEDVRFFRAGAAHLDVVPDGTGIDGGLLQDAADVFADDAAVDPGRLYAVEEDLPLGRQAEGQQPLPVPPMTAIFCPGRMCMLTSCTAASDAPS